MRRTCLTILVWLWASTSPAFSQAIDQEPANNRQADLLRHPTFIILRLLSEPRDPSKEKPSDTPPPYSENEWISFQLSITQNASEDIAIWNELNPYYQYRPELMKDGDLVAYSSKAQVGVKVAETTPPSGSSAPLTLEPARELQTDHINLKDWYDPLRPGRYQLVVRKRFVWDGDWVESNPIIFEVRSRKPPDPFPFRSRGFQKWHRFLMAHFIIGDEGKHGCRMFLTKEQRISGMAILLTSSNGWIIGYEQQWHATDVRSGSCNDSFVEQRGFCQHRFCINHDLKITFLVH